MDKRKGRGEKRGGEGEEYGRRREKRSLRKHWEKMHGGKMEEDWEEIKVRVGRALEKIKKEKR